MTEIFYKDRQGTFSRRRVQGALNTRAGKCCNVACRGTLLNITLRISQEQRSRKPCYTNSIQTSDRLQQIRTRCKRRCCCRAMMWEPLQLGKDNSDLHVHIVFLAFILPGSSTTVRTAWKMNGHIMIMKPMTACIMPSRSQPRHQYLGRQSQNSHWRHRKQQQQM